MLLGHTSFYPLDERVNVVCLEPESGKRFGTVQRVKKLHSLLKKNCPDVLVGMSPFMSAYAVFCTIGLRTAAVGTERANPFVLYADRKTTFLRKTVSFLCKGFVCQTEKALSFFPASVRRKAAVIPNAVFNPLVFDTSVPNEREKVITAVGRLDHNKAFDILLKAFAKVHAEYPDHGLTIYGDGPDRDALLSLADRLGVAQQFHLPGKIPDAILSVARSVVFVLSSRSEGMPNALMEAMAAGVPCISTRCDMGPEELIRDGENGLLVPVDDPDALADAILRILHDDTLADELSCHALEIRETHSIRSVAALWLAYFQHITGIL